MSTTIGIKRNDLFVAAMGGAALMANVTGSLAATFASMVAFPLLIWALRENASRKADRAVERRAAKGAVHG